ncbi:MAG: nucleoside triphosphate pyrophosphohydrolase, partial [Acidimicrobiales bacterium]
AETGQFELSDVARGIHDKLVARHPHVFGDAEHAPGDWEAMKRAEKGRTSAMDGIPATLPALAYAQKVIGRARSAGLGDDTGDLQPGGLQPGEQLDAEHLGRALFMLAELAERADLDAEETLRKAAVTYAADVRRREAQNAQEAEGPTEP